MDSFMHLIFKNGKLLICRSKFGTSNNCIDRYLSRLPSSVICMRECMLNNYIDPIHIKCARLPHYIANNLLNTLLTIISILGRYVWHNLIINHPLLSCCHTTHSISAHSVKPSSHNKYPATHHISMYSRMKLYEAVWSCMKLYSCTYHISQETIKQWNLMIHNHEEHR